MLYLALFLVLPLGRVLGEAAVAVATGRVGLDLAGGYGEYILRITGNSLTVASLTAIISVALGLPLAFFVAKARTPGRAVFAVLLALPLITPPFISAFATILLFGRTGVITQLLASVGIPELRIFGATGIVLTHVLHFIPLAYLTIAAGLRIVPPWLEEAAASLGSSTAEVQRRVVLPYVAPHVLMAGVLVFLASFGDVGAPLLVAGDYRVLALETYTSFTGIGGDPELPIVLAAWSVLLSIAALVAVKMLIERTQVRHSFTARALVHDSRPLRVVGLLFCSVISLFLLLPYVAIGISSFGTVWGAGLLPNAFTTRNYEFVMGHPEAFVVSLALAAIATPICVALALFGNLLLREHPRAAAALDHVTLLPFVIPGVVIGIGLVSTYNGLAVLGAPIPLAGTPALMVVAFSVRRLPWAMRVMAAGYARIDSALEEASASLGASRLRTFRQVTLPQLAPVLAATGTIAFIRVITELGSSLVLYPPGWRTAPVAIYYYVVEGFIGRASAIGVVLVAIVALASVLVSLDRRAIWRAARAPLGRLPRRRRAVPKAA